MIAPSVHRISLEDEEPARRFLAQRPYENVLLDWLIEHDRSAAMRQRLFCCREKNGEITGIAHFGRQVALAAQTPEAVQALANAGYAYRHERMIVAGRDVARGYWEAVKSWHTPPRLVRERQPVFVVQTHQLPKSRQTKISTRLARIDEADLVIENSAAMIEYELGYDPRRASASFRWNVRRMIERQMWWVGLQDERPVFYCHIGPHSKQTVQLQGVWTPLADRRTGVAKAALTAICLALLEDYPTVSLYVNDFNIAAVTLYRSLGFQESGELCTYLF
ncbi:MAG: GNAT family N-acetyltransferase [Candidatus Eremiobacteraeota bacterium]|nr:GNAT family N-acetyltransferase [Candidatus Eremiobacteraeota bacterium]